MSKTNDNTPNAEKTKARRQRKPTQVPVSAQLALEMLASAVSYCQQAGIKIGAANGDNGTLGLFVPNAYYTLEDNGTRAAFHLK